MSGVGRGALWAACLARGARLRRWAGREAYPTGARLQIGVLCCCTIALAQTPSALERIAARITANDLKADVSFLASDALEGRGTPSRGLDIAAEYIAAGFRRAGLEPAGDDGYFQTAPYALVTPNLEGLELTIETGGQAIKAERTAIRIQEPRATDLTHAEAVKTDLAALDALTEDQVKGKVLIVEVPDPSGFSPEQRRDLFARLRRVPALAHKFGAALVIQIGGAGQPTNASARLREVSYGAVPFLVVSDSAVRGALAAAKAGPLEATVSAHLAAPAAAPVKLRNAIGVLRGSDAALKNTYVVVTAHYDHLGVRGTGEGDHIYNGANDDASGTASVIEIAAALAALPERPKRSIVFIALFGEELGLVGARYYVQHPVFPLLDTVADINLEQVGRTDDSEGPRVRQFNLTGFDYSNIAGIFGKAGEEAGIRAVKDEKKSDSYFGASDNAPFAAAGVPATTLSVSYVFPDYHKAGDEWPKLDYDNMAKVDCAVALGVLRMADSAEAPQWNRDNPKTASFVQARDKAVGAGATAR